MHACVDDMVNMTISMHMINQLHIIFQVRSSSCFLSIKKKALWNSSKNKSSSQCCLYTYASTNWALPNTSSIAYCTCHQAEQKTAGMGRLRHCLRGKRALEGNSVHTVFTWARISTVLRSIYNGEASFWIWTLISWSRFWNNKSIFGFSSIFVHTNATKKFQMSKRGGCYKKILFKRDSIF